MPGVSTSAESAARSLWKAVLDGEPEVVVGWNARLAVLAHNLFPAWTSEALGLVNRAMPSSDQAHGPAIRGEELSGKVPDLLNRLIPSGTRPNPA